MVAFGLATLGSFVVADGTPLANLVVSFDYAPAASVGRGFAGGLMLVGIGSFATATPACGVIVGRVRPRASDPVGEAIESLGRLESTLGRLESELRGRSSRDGS